MAFRRNPGYRTDPAIREGFNNLAAMFAPPSGAELAGFAAANAKRAEAERIADLYARAGNANLTPEQMTALDQQMAVQAGGWQNSRWRFGQDDRRLRDINAADNQRMLATNAADNQRAVAVEAMRPIARDAVAPAMPSIANQFGIPELAQPRRGIVEVAPGQRAVLPDNSVIEGAPKPRTSDEVVAAIMEDQLRLGGVTPQAVIGPKLGTPVQVQGEQGPRFMSPGEAMTSGARPVAPQATGPRKDAVAVLPDGQRVPVTRAPDGLQWQLADGSPLPQGSAVASMPSQVGPADPLDRGTNNNITERNRVLANIASTEALLNIYEGIITRNPGAIGLVGAIRGTAQNLISSGSDLAAAFGNNVPQIQAAQNNLREGLAKATGRDMFDPSIPEAEFIQSTLAYALARAENGGTDVSNRDFQNALDRVRGGGLLANSDSARAAIGASRKSLQAQRVRAETLANPGSAASGAAPGAPAAQPQGRLRFDANGNMIQ